MFTNQLKIWGWCFHALLVNLKAMHVIVPCLLTTRFPAGLRTSLPTSLLLLATTAPAAALCLFLLLLLLLLPLPRIPSPAAMEYDGGIRNLSRQH